MWLGIILDMAACIAASMVARAALGLDGFVDFWTE
jgi:hypothetical protein